MATWRGYEAPPAVNALSLGRQRLPELPDEWNFPGPWEDAQPDYNPRPGQKGYDPRNQLAMSRRPEAPNPLLYSNDVGYWLSGAPSGMPAHAYSDYLRWLSQGQNALAPGGR